MAVHPVLDAGLGEAPREDEGDRVGVDNFEGVRDEAVREAGVASEGRVADDERRTSRGALCVVEPVLRNHTGVLGDQVERQDIQARAGEEQVGEGSTASRGLDDACERVERKSLKAELSDLGTRVELVVRILRPAGACRTRAGTGAGVRGTRSTVRASPRSSTRFRLYRCRPFGGGLIGWPGPASLLRVGARRLNRQSQWWAVVSALMKMTEPPIATRQNDDACQRLLAAQSVLYTRAKKLRRWRLVAVTSSAFLVAVATLAVGAATAPIGVAGGLLVLFASIVQGKREGALVERAVAIQEKFDTQVFNLKWNEFAVPNQPTGHEVQEEAAK